MTVEEATLLARQAAEENGWEWHEPTIASLHRRLFRKGGVWEIWSNNARPGATVKISIDDQTAVVLERRKFSIPR
jgi:hypothetical protein